MKRTIWCFLITSCIGYTVALGFASAVPLCSAIDPEVSLAAFTSCGASGQDTLLAVQEVLNHTLTSQITLRAAESFCPGGRCDGRAFTADRLADNFDITYVDDHTFTFNALPVGTQFVTIQQANGFTVFQVPALGSPFTVTTSSSPSDSSRFGTGFSHFGTFVPAAVSVPEPSSTLLLSISLVGIGIAGSSVRCWTGVSSPASGNFCRR
jgi:hypothetical protein